MLKITFFANKNKAFEKKLVDAVSDGFPKLNVVSNREFADCDLVLLMGIKNYDILEYYVARNVPVVYFDKAHDRSKDAFRICFNSNQPTRNMIDKRRNNSRSNKFGWHPVDWRKSGDAVIVAGSSAKYHEVSGLPDPTSYARDLISIIKSRTNKRIIYRPKPSWRDAVPIDGAEYSHSGTINDLLIQSHVLITYGSNACFDALRAGVPSIVLGDGATRSISSTRLDIDFPFYASAREVQQFMNNLAYHQWTYEEFRNGTFWGFVKCELRL
jgi:hypothetical protein